MLSQTKFTRSAPSYTRALLSDKRVYNTPIELLATLCRLDEGPSSSEGAKLGDQLLLESGSTGELLSFKLVLPAEVTLTHYHLSALSPLGQAVYGRKPGEVFYISIGGQRLQFRLLHAHKNGHNKEDCHLEAR